MAKYSVTFSCGHTATIQLFGKETDRQRKIKWYEESGLCPDCYRKQQEEEKKKREEAEAKEAKGLGLADLTGTEKQISWANSIRNSQIKDIEGYISNLNFHINAYRKNSEHEDRIADAEKMLTFLSTMENIIGEEDSAHKIIDWRNTRIATLAECYMKIEKDIASGKKIPDDYLDEYGSELFVKTLRAMYGIEAPKQEAAALLSPEKKTSDILASVSYTDSKVTIESPKDYTIIGIARNNGYRWDGYEWVLQVTLKTGKPEDRAAEIANELLNSGYQVKVPESIANAAVSGKYEPRRTRWISAYDGDSGHVYVSWDKDDDMYNTAKKLSGSKWVRGRGMRIPTSSADEIEEFAETYGFMISGGALKNIDTYRRKVKVVDPKEGLEEKKINNGDSIKNILNSSRDIIEDLKDD